MQFRLPKLLNNGRDSGDLTDPLPDEFAGLVREAFPLPTASEALRQRVAFHTADALESHAATPSPQHWGAGGAHRLPHSHTPTPPHSRMRLALAGTLAALLLLPLCSTQKGGAGQAFASAPPTPGQLALVDAAGQPLGLCPLKHTDVDAEISGYVARVTVKQQFQNPSSTPVEAIYTFPLPEDAAVDDMTMILGADRIVKGEIKRRQEAREIYEAARDAGQAAALLDQERPNLFTQSVANLMPGESVTIAISYVNTLKYEAGQYEFAFPMVVGPRYTGGSSSGYQAPDLRGEPSPIRQFQGDPGAQTVVTDAEKITPPITPPNTRAGHDISVRVNLDAGLPLQAIHSELHPIDVQRQGDSRAVVRLRDVNTLPNQDFILQYGVAGAGLQTGVLTQADERGGGHFTVVVQPPVTPAALEPRAKEIVFVIDQTGSQSGWPIRKAKETMGYLIRNMNPGDTFQLLGFNTEVFPCFERPVSNNPGNVARAQRFLEPIEGEGGTDILQAVDYALQIPPDRNRRRIICYLTDGFVGNDMQILGYVRKHRGEAHMFPFGIGDAPNRFLINGMAREGHGTAEFVTLNSSAEAAAARFYRRISQPILTGVGVDWNGLPVEEVYPSRIPDLFVSGRPIQLKGRFTASAQGEIILHGSLGGRPWRQAVPVSFGPASDDGEALAALWAREKIEDLQGRDWEGQQTGNPNPAIVEKIVDVALQYRLMSQHTSFVAVEQKVVNLLGKPQVVDIPVELPEGMAYEGIFRNQAQTPKAEDRLTDREGAPSDVLLANPEPAANLLQYRANPFAPNKELADVITAIPAPAANASIPSDNQDDSLSSDNLIVSGGIGRVHNSRDYAAVPSSDGATYEFDSPGASGRASNVAPNSVYRPVPQVPTMGPGISASGPQSPQLLFGEHGRTTMADGSLARKGNINSRFQNNQHQAPPRGLNGYFQSEINVSSPNAFNYLPAPPHAMFRGDPASDKAPYYNVIQPKPQTPSLIPYDSGVQQQQQGQQLRPNWYYPPNGQRQGSSNFDAISDARSNNYGTYWRGNLSEFNPSTVAPLLVDPVGRAQGPRSKSADVEFSTTTESGRRNGDAYEDPKLDELISQGARQGMKRAVANTQTTAPARPALDKLAVSLRQVLLAARRALKRTNGAIEGRWDGDRRVAVQLWISPLPPEGLRQLQAAGFEAVTVLRPNLVTLGTVRVADLEKLAALPFVVYIDPPRLR